MFFELKTKIGKHYTYLLLFSGNLATTQKLFYNFFTTQVITFLPPAFSLSQQPDPVSVRRILTLKPVAIAVAYDTTEKPTPVLANRYRENSEARTPPNHKVFSYAPEIRVFKKFTNSTFLKKYSL